MMELLWYAVTMKNVKSGFILTVSILKFRKGRSGTVRVVKIDRWGIYIAMYTNFCQQDCIFELYAVACRGYVASSLMITSLIHLLFYLTSRSQ